ncbi:hypothetical protein AUJ93_01160 [bacterium CG2_30_33_46]|nr:MAG: hypothetical protein AUJ93_01160 [bacterium CG2_30_33_46]
MSAIDLSDFFKLLSDPNRLKVISLLSKQDLCVCKIYKSLRLSQNLVSHHLSKLKSAGLLKERRDGNFIIYSLDKVVFRKYRSIFINLI